MTMLRRVTCSSFTNVYKSKKRETTKAFQDTLNKVSYPLKDDILQKLEMIEKKIDKQTNLQDERMDIILNEILLLKLDNKSHIKK